MLLQEDVQRIFATESFLWIFIVAWGNSKKTGDKEFIAGQLKVMKKFDGKRGGLVAKGGDMATGSTSGTATGMASAAHSALTKSAEATTSAMAPAKSAAAPAQVSILAAAPTIPTDMATAPPWLRKMYRSKLRPISKKPDEDIEESGNQGKGKESGNQDEGKADVDVVEGHQVHEAKRALERGSQREIWCTRCAWLRIECYELLNAKHACWSCNRSKVKCEMGGAVPAARSQKGNGPARKKRKMDSEEEEETGPKFTRAEKGKSKGES